MRCSVVFFTAVLLILNVFDIGNCGFLDEMDNSDVIAVKTRLEDEKSQRLLLQNDVEMLMVKVAKLERTGSSPECRQNRSAVTIAFTARLSANAVLSVGITLVFNHVITNRGSAYDSSSGVFRAPIAGTYVFTATILCQHKKLAEVAIVKDNVRIASVLAGETGTGWHDQGSVTVALELQLNDDVHVESLMGSHVHADYYTVFSGFLLRE